MSPYSFDTSPLSTGGATAFQQTNDRDWSSAGATQDSIPIGAIPLLATNTQEYHESVHKTILTANNVYNGKYQLRKKTLLYNIKLMCKASHSFFSFDYFILCTYK